MESIVLMVVLIVLMYFMMIRPESKRKKKAQEMRESLKKGDIITTIGGILGKIVAVYPDTIIIETSEDRVRLEMLKWAVSSVNTPVNATEEKKAEEKEDKNEETASQNEENKE